MFYVYCPYSIIFFVRIEKHACEQNCCKQHYLFLGILQEADGKWQRRHATSTRKCGEDVEKEIQERLREKLENVEQSHFEQGMFPDISLLFTTLPLYWNQWYTHKIYLPTCTPIYLHIHLPDYAYLDLPTWLHYLPTWLLTYLLTYLPSSLLTYLPTWLYLPIYLPDYLPRSTYLTTLLWCTYLTTLPYPTWLLTYLLTYLPTWLYLPIYLPDYLPRSTYLTTYLPTFKFF